MYAYIRLSQAYKSSKAFSIDNKSRIVFFSDCHRGDNSKADNFSPNKDIYMSALDYYNSKEYTYVEIGDGDELWENDNFIDLYKSHTEVYSLLQKFYRDNRLYMICGNHDIYKKHRRFVKRNLYKCYNPKTQKHEPLFENIKIHEGLILHYRGTPYKIFVVHGHQGDFLNDAFWPVSRFLVRYLWKNFENLAYRNSISPARNKVRMNAVERGIRCWIKAKNRMVIAGHTHNPVFAAPGDIPYFNDGCCVKKGYITCIEIQDGKIMLVKWERILNTDGTTSISKEIIAGPEELTAFFRN